MNSAQPSLLSLVAAGIYILVVLATLAAAVAATRFRQQAWHWRVWGLIAVLFLVLALMRSLALEEIFRDELRMLLRTKSAYDSRRDLQRPLAAGAIAIAFTAALLWLLRVGQIIRGRRNVAVVAASVGAVAMTMLLMLRLISLHQVDRLLYGPFKVNWLVDIGASVAILASAAIYIRQVVRAPGTRR